MKRFFATIIVLSVTICCLSSCGKSDYAREREEERESIYEKGYEAGYEEGYREGISEALNQIASCVDDDLWSLKHDIEDEWGMDPEEAIRILTNYADGEPISEIDLNKAIWVVWEYYKGVNEIADDVDDYWID